MGYLLAGFGSGGLGAIMVTAGSRATDLVSHGRGVLSSFYVLPGTAPNNGLSSVVDGRFVSSLTHGIKVAIPRD